MMDDQILTAVNELKKKVENLSDTVDALSTKVLALETRWRWISSAALLLVGAVGGPNAVQLITAMH